MPETPRTTKGILEAYRCWAVVGLSDDPARESYRVAHFLAERGYRIVPVNPRIESWEGEKAYPDLLSIPFVVEVVDLFRRPEKIPAHVEQAIRIGAMAVWLQLGVVHAEAAARAKAAGLTVIQDRCPLIETRRLWPADDGPRFDRSAGLRSDRPDRNRNPRTPPNGRPR